MGNEISDIGKVGIYQDALFNPFPFSLLARIKIKERHERVEEFGMTVAQPLRLLEEQLDGHGEELR